MWLWRISNTGLVLPLRSIRRRSGGVLGGEAFYSRPELNHLVCWGPVMFSFSIGIRFLRVLNKCFVQLDAAAHHRVRRAA